MKQYIDKSALVAWAKETYLCENASMIRKVCYKQLLEHLDTLEVKEVDCEREIGMFTTKELLQKRNKATNVFHLTQGDIDRIAKHFYELGLKSKGE